MAGGCKMFKFNNEGYDLGRMKIEIFILMAKSCMTQFSSSGWSVIYPVLFNLNKSGSHPLLFINRWVANVNVHTPSGIVGKLNFEFNGFVLTVEYICLCLMVKSWSVWVGILDMVLLLKFLQKKYFCEFDLSNRNYRKKMFELLCRNIGMTVCDCILDR